MAKQRHKGELVTGIPTEDWNEFARTSQLVSLLQRNGNSPGKSTRASRLTVPVFNNTGAEITAEFPILKITPTYPMSDDRLNAAYEPLAFDGTTPASDTETGEIVIVQGPIAKGAGGSGVLLGPSLAKVEFTDSGHGSAVPKSGDNTKLSSSSSGLKILWHETLGTLPATKWALVLLGGGGGSADVAYRVAKVTAEIAAATDDLPENWGTGTGQPYDFSLGYIDEGAAAIELHNMLPFPILENAWVKYSVVYVGGAIAAYVNLVDNATCYEYPWHVEA